MGPSFHCLSFSTCRLQRLRRNQWLHSSSSFATNAGLHPGLKGSAFPTIPQSVSRGAGISELYYSSLSLRPADLFALLTDQTRLSPRPKGLLLPGFRQHGHPFLTLDIATVATGRFPRTGLAPVGFTASFAALRLDAAGIQCRRRGPHCLRHACATHLLEQGASLKEIGDLLGHRDANSTRIYAKVHLQQLRRVADFNLGGLL